MLAQEISFLCSKALASMAEKEPLTKIDHLTPCETKDLNRRLNFTFDFRFTSGRRSPQDWRLLPNSMHLQNFSYQLAYHQVS
jgi:hypothetical protein